MFTCASYLFHECVWGYGGITPCILPSALDVCEYIASRTDQFTRCERDTCTRWVVSRFREERNLCPPAGNRTWCSWPAIPGLSHSADLVVHNIVRGVYFNFAHMHRAQRQHNSLHLQCIISIQCFLQTRKCLVT